MDYSDYPDAMLIAMAAAAAANGWREVKQQIEAELRNRQSTPAAGKNNAR